MSTAKRHFTTLVSCWQFLSLITLILLPDLCSKNESCVIICSHIVIKKGVKLHIMHVQVYFKLAHTGNDVKKIFLVNILLRFFSYVQDLDQLLADNGVLVTNNHDTTSYGCVGKGHHC